MPESTVIASIPDGETLRPVTIADYNRWVAAKPPDKRRIAEAVCHRFHGRYIRPFSFPDERYAALYKHGFPILASSCLLIEALESFRNGWEETPREPGGCQVFEGFFAREPAFRGFRDLNFYKNVRCGLLHQGETTGGYTVNRKPTTPLLKNKGINAVKFSAALEAAIGRYRDELLNAEWDSEIWDNLRRKMRFVIKNCS